MPHAGNLWSSTHSVAVAPPPSSRSSRSFSTARQEAARAASEILASVADVVPIQRIADELEVHRSAVEHWADPNDPAALTLRDILAMPPAAARDILEKAMEHVDREAAAPVATPATAVVLDLSALASDASAVVSRAVADLSVDRDEWLVIRKAGAGLRKAVRRVEQLASMFEPGATAKAGRRG